jgi:hypothetical protein
VPTLPERVEAIERRAAGVREPYANTQGYRLAHRLGARLPWRIRAAIAGLEGMLRRQPGIAVRLPSHTSAPFRAEPFLFETYANLQNANATADYLIRFNGNDAIPATYRAEVHRVVVTAYIATSNSPIATLADNTRWTLERNGAALPGHTQRFAIHYTDSAVATSLLSYGPQSFVSDAPSLIHLQENDALLCRVTAGAALTAAVGIAIVGYLYPLRDAGEGIRATLQD